MKNPTGIVPLQGVTTVIRIIRNLRVILDADLAELYGVSTKALNQAVKRNQVRFPLDFIFQMTPGETEAMNRSQIVTGSQKHRDPRFPPYAFTEHGAIMVATILNSPRATAMSVYVIRAFIRMREEIAANAAILKRLAEIDKNLLLHDVALRDIYQKLRPLLEPPTLPPKPEIGFHVKEASVPYRVRRRRLTANSR
jgi:hypothetical protein